MVKSRNILFIAFLFLGILLLSQPAVAQCSICTKTAQQLGEQPAKGLNAGILYLAFIPLGFIGVIAYRWWKAEVAASS